MSVRHRFQRRECLGGDDEEGLRWIEIMDGFREVGAVNVGHKAKRKCSVGVKPQRLVGHYRAQVGTTDANVDDITNALASVTLPLAAPYAIGEVGHAVEHGMNLWNDVLAIYYDGGASRRAQGYVQNCSLFRDVDFFAAKHGVDALLKAR